MSKKSRKRLKALALMGAALGASKLGLLPTGSTVGKGAMGAGDKFAAARKAMTSDAAMRGRSAVKGVKGKGPLLGVAEGITKLKRSDLPEKRNLKSIFVSPDGSITRGLEKFKDKETYAKTMKARRGERGSTDLKSFLNRFVLGPKTKLNNGGEVQIKTKLNGTVKTKTY